MRQNTLVRFILLIPLTLFVLISCKGRSQKVEPAVYTVSSSSPPSQQLDLQMKNKDRIAVDSGHYLAVMDDGRVAVWGSGRFLNVPDGLNNVVAVSTGAYHSIALKSDGSIISWGAFSEIPEGLTDEIGFIAIAAGVKQSIGLRADGSVVSWGEPLEIPEDLTDVIDISASSYHFSAVKADGTVVSWGRYTWGICESNCLYDFPPTTYSSYSGIASVAARETIDVLGLSDSGDLYRFGLSPSVEGDKIEIDGISQTVSIDSSYSHYLSLGEDGDVYSWSKTEDGVLKQSQEFTSGISAIAAASYYENVALTKNGKVVVWNANLDSRYSSDTPTYVISDVQNVKAVSPILSLKNDGSVDPLHISPEADIQQAMAEVKNITQVSSRNGRGFAITDSGDVYVMTNASSSIVPDSGVRKIFENSGIINIAPGQIWNLALKNDGTVELFKFEKNGGISFDFPLEQPFLQDIKAIANGGSHYLAVDNQGEVYAWGINNTNIGQTDVPQGLTDVVAVSAGTSHSMALKSDGTVVIWGEFYVENTNNSGAAFDTSTDIATGTSIPTYLPDGLTEVIGIASSSNHALALKSDGTVVAWGDNGAGQTNVPAGLKDVVAISSYGNYDSASQALRSDGTVIVWGQHNYSIEMHEIWASEADILPIKSTRCEAGYASINGECKTPQGCVYPLLEESLISGLEGGEDSFQCPSQCTLGISSIPGICEELGLPGAPPLE